TWGRWQSSQRPRRELAIVAHVLCEVPTGRLGLEDLLVVTLGRRTGVGVTLTVEELNTEFPILVADGLDIARGHWLHLHRLVLLDCAARCRAFCARISATDRSRACLRKRSYRRMARTS